MRYKILLINCFDLAAKIADGIILSNQAIQRTQQVNIVTVKSQFANLTGTNAEQI